MPAEQPPQSRVGAGTVVLLGAWIGLIAGFGDVSLLILYQRWISRDFYRIGVDFPWIIPSGVTLLVVAPAILLAVSVRFRGPIRLEVPLVFLAFIGFVDVCSRLRLAFWATLLISCGLTAQLVRLVRPHKAGFLRLVRRTTGVLVAMLIATVLATAGKRSWTEHQKRTSLPPAPEGSRNVLLIVWDTVRAANTSLYGYRRPTTPNLERLANRGVRFDLAFATSSWTLPSHAGLFTGKWPHELGVDWKRPMVDGVPTLAGFLGSRGYDTAGFVANLDYCSRETGLARGFTHYEDFSLNLLDTFTSYIAIGRRVDITSLAFAMDALAERYTGRWFNLIPRPKEHAKRADAINDAFLAWLDGRPSEARPFFAFLNYNDAHGPYEVPDPSHRGFGLRPASASQRKAVHGYEGQVKTKFTYEDVRMINDVYDDCIFYLDRNLGSLLAELGRRGILDHTLVIITSDHGEHLGDHGIFFHGCSLYRELVQVPLLIVGENLAPSGRTVSAPVSLCDIPATVIDLAGLDPHHGFPGQSLSRHWRLSAQDGGRVPPRPLLMETTKPELITNGGREPAAKGPMKAIVAAGMHYIRAGDGTEEMFNLLTDVDEKVNLALEASAYPVVLQFRNLLGFMLKKR